MRRFLVIVAGLGALQTGIGCQHMGGKCDCVPLVAPCAKYGLYAPENSAVQTTHKVEASAVEAPGLQREKIQLPKEGL